MAKKSTKKTASKKDTKKTTSKKDNGKTSRSAELKQLKKEKPFDIQALARKLGTTSRKARKFLRGIKYRPDRGWYRFSEKDLLSLQREWEKVQMTETSEPKEKATPKKKSTKKAVKK